MPIRGLSSIHAFDKLIQVWVSEPWRALQQTFMVMTALTLFWGFTGALLSGFEASPYVRVRDVPAEISLRAPPAWDYYSSVILNRDLFGASAAALAKPKLRVAVPAPPPVHKATLAELASDLTLVGIVNNGRPQAALMSNSTKEVSYVSVGQQIGAITVMGIEGNQVKLTYEGETLALSF